MKNKILDYSVTDTLSNIYDGECLNLYAGANLLLLFSYAAFGSIISMSDGISMEDNIKIINTLIGTCTLIPSAILLKNLKQVLSQKQMLSKKVNEINELKKKFGLGKINYIEREYVSDGEYDITITDRKGKIVHLKEVRNMLSDNMETFFEDEPNKKVLK